MLASTEIFIHATLRQKVEKKENNILFCFYFVQYSEIVTDTQNLISQKATQ